MKIIIREGACIGCGACIAVDPNHFDFNEDGFAEVIDNSELDTNAVRNAVESCPTTAICVEDCPEGCDCGASCDCGDSCECTEDNKCSDDCNCANEKSEN